MNECDDGVEKTALPGEQAQPPQSIQKTSDQVPPADGRTFLRDIIDRNEMKRQRAETRPSVLDHARFAAGIISLYETVLSEPIPEKMLRLIEEIGKQERKS